MWLSGATGFRADPNELVDALVDSGVGIDNLYRGLARRMQADERPNLPLIRRMNIACGLALACPVLATCVRSLAQERVRSTGRFAPAIGAISRGLESNAAARAYIRQPPTSFVRRQIRQTAQPGGAPTVTWLPGAAHSSPGPPLGRGSIHMLSQPAGCHVKPQ